MKPNSPTSGLFHTSELTRLVVLLAILAFGGALFYSSYQKQQQQQNQAQQQRLPKGERPVAGGPPLPPPAEGLEFTGLLDKTELTPRDNPAYKTLLDWTRATPADRLHRLARRDVLFSQLIELPERYRGIPIHLEGTAKRIMVQETPGSKLFPKGKYFEAYVTTPDSVYNPYILVFEDAPAGMPIGDQLNEAVAFDGYFFKLLAYRAGDTARFAPLLVGRLRWLDERPNAEAAPAPVNFAIGPYFGWAVAALIVYLIVRWSYSLLKLLGKPTAPARSGPPVRDAIEPEELSRWLGDQAKADPPADDESWP